MICDAGSAGEYGSFERLRAAVHAAKLTVELVAVNVATAGAAPLNAAETLPSDRP